MNKVPFFLLIFIVILSSSFIRKEKSFEQKEKGFKIIGFVKGFEDNTKIFIKYRAQVDSTFIVNGQFEFSGTIPQKTKHVIIRTANFEDYKYVWLENAIITFKAEKGKFYYAEISGSASQNIVDKLYRTIDPLQDRRDSLTKTLDKDSSIVYKEKVNKELNRIQKKIRSEQIAFIKDNPDSPASADMLKVMCTTFGKEKSKELYDNFTEEIKNSKDGKEILEFINLNKDVKTGDKYVDFTQYYSNGSAVKLSDFHGKIILLEFWASWCNPCQRELPHLINIYNDFKGKDFEILAVSIDNNKNNWLDAIKKYNLIWKNVSELNGEENKAAMIYGINGIPDNFLIDRNGIIIGRDLRGQALRDKLEEILK